MEDRRFNNAFDIQTGYRTKSVLVAHIRNHVGKNIGVVQCINKALDDKFTKMDQLLLDAFASQCAVAIENLEMRRGWPTYSSIFHSTKPAHMIFTSRLIWKKYH